MGTKEPNNLTERVARNVVWMMTLSGDTESSLAEATHIPRVTLRRRLSGATPFTVRELDAIATHFATTPVDFFTRGAA